MRHPIATTLALGGLLAFMPLSGHAQQTSPWWSWALPLVEGGTTVRTASGLRTIPRAGDRDDDWERARRGGDPRAGNGGSDRRGTIYRRGDDRGRGKGPKFCRNGQGHPVKGMAWCREHGFSSRPVWSRARIGDIILRPDRGGYGSLDRGGLRDVLGSVILGRLVRDAGSTGGVLSGRMFRPRGTRVTVLQIREGGRPVAELTDLDADGRADVVLVSRRH